MRFLHQIIVSFALAASSALLGAGDSPFLELVSPFEPAPRTLEAPDADAAWKPIPEMASMEGLMAAVAGKTTLEERLTAMRELQVTVARQATAFIRKYPEDPRRWRAVQIMASMTGDLAHEDGTPKEILEGVSWEPETFIAWRTQLDTLAAAAASAPDAPPEVKARAEIKKPGGLGEIFDTLSSSIRSGETVDFGPFLAELSRLAAAYPTVDRLSRYINYYVSLRTEAGAGKEERVADLQAFVNSPSEPIRSAVKIELDKLTAFDKALELSFTAVDGREVDIEDYRGKVVLIDFWATWCGPCIAEIPNIKEVYAEYREEGFEIIGIALENARLSPGDTPEETEAKHARARKVLNDFTARYGMDWPQYYDGKFWKNDIAQRFGIASIPAMFLIDQEGRIVSTEARGHALETEVRRLLGDTPPTESNPFSELVSPFPPSKAVLEASDAETAWAPIPEMGSMEGIMAAAASSGETTVEGRRNAIFLHLLEIAKRATTFMQRFPDHPQRWRAVQLIASFPSEFANEDGTPKHALEGFTWDVEKFQQFREQLARLSVAAQSATDAPDEVRMMLEIGQPGGLQELLRTAQEAVQAGNTVEWELLRERIFNIGAKYPEAEIIRNFVNLYSQFRTAADSPKEEMMADFERLVDNPSEYVRTAAQQEIDKLTAFDKAFELSFTAVDGREVNIEDYRGKVVLIDFWATWCGPCIAEIPNIKQVYAEYRDKGFEIIGVALENARLSAGDTPEQTEAKHTRAKKVLNEFTARYEMPWPQYYDGKFWSNDIAQRFGIASIPAMFLIDKEGRIASTEARGHILEAEVRRLLGLEPEQKEEG